MSDNKGDIARFDVRLPSSLKALLERAAELGNFRSFTEFILASAREKAEQIVEEHDAILRSEEDRRIFFEAVLNPAKPSQKLKDAALEYENLLNQGNGLFDNPPGKKS